MSKFNTSFVNKHHITLFDCPRSAELKVYSMIVKLIMIESTVNDTCKNTITSSRVVNRLTVLQFTTK